MKTSIAAIAAATMVTAGAAAEAATVYASDVHIDAGENQDRGDSQRFGPDNALGPDDDNDFYSLGLGGSALFTFGGNILGSGTLVEVTFNCSVEQSGFCGGYSEEAEIYGIGGPIDLAGLEDGFAGGIQNSDLTGLSRTLIDAIPNGSAQSGFAFDTGGNTYAGLLIVDTSSNTGDGFDVASVAATPAPVPLPPAAALLFGAVGGLGLLRRRGA